jgi:hypothetical protein
MAACRSGKPIMIEPFPPHFLKKDQVRSRSGAFDEAVKLKKAKTNEDDQNKDSGLMLKVLGALPDLAELAELESEAKVVEYMSKKQEAFVKETHLNNTDKLLGYRLLRFILATSRPILTPVSLSDSALRDVEPGAVYRKPEPVRIVQPPPVNGIESIPEIGKPPPPPPRLAVGERRERLAGALNLTGAPDMEPNLDQYAILTNGPAEAQFRALREKHGGTSAFAFHGSPLHCWYSILRNGLRNLSHTGLMTTGAACGSGVYLAENMSLSGGYCRGAASAGSSLCAREDS